MQTVARKINADPAVTCERSCNILRGKARFWHRNGDGIDERTPWDDLLKRSESVADDWFTNQNRVILFTCPEKEALHVPGESEILAVLNEGESMPFEPYQEADLSAPLEKERLIKEAS